MGCFCWSFSAKLIVGMLLNVVYGQDQEPKTHIQQGSLTSVVTLAVH